MKKINIAINGFGRIGRVFLRNAITNPQINIVAINDITDSATLAHLLKYDSVHRKFNGEVKHDKDHLYIDGKEIRIFASKDPENLPWKSLDIDIVIESTGLFLDKASARKHLNAGAKKIILSAPAKDDDIKTIVMGVNDDLLNGSRKQLAAPFNDVIVFARDWGFRLDEVTVPVRWWHGDHDHIIPFFHGEHVVSRLPNAELFHLPGESHLAGLGRGEEILATLMKVWDEEA